MKADAADPLTAQAWPLGQDEALAAALLAIDPIGLGGACLRAAAGPWRHAWLDRLQALLPAGTPLRRLPHGASDSALLGGLDLAATLSRGQPVLQPGLLSQANGGLLLLAMAERASADTGAPKPPERPALTARAARRHGAQPERAAGRGGARRRPQ